MPSVQKLRTVIGVVIWIKALNQEPALELHSRAVPSLKAHHRGNGPDKGRNSGGRQKKNILYLGIPVEVNVTKPFRQGGE